LHIRQQLTTRQAAGTPDIVAVTLTPAIVVSITSAGNDLGFPAGEKHVLCRACQSWRRTTHCLA